MPCLSVECPRPVIDTTMFVSRMPRPVSANAMSVDRRPSSSLPSTRRARAPCEPSVNNAVYASGRGISWLRRTIIDAMWPGCGEHVAPSFMFVSYWLGLQTACTTDSRRPRPPPKQLAQQTTSTTDSEILVKIILAGRLWCREQVGCSDKANKLLNMCHHKVKYISLIGKLQFQSIINQKELEPVEMLSHTWHLQGY